jgi:acetone carboxylase gamma subunit
MPVEIVQWLIFRGIGHAQTGTNAVVPTLPVVACGRTAWPGIYRYTPTQPKHLCPECAVALGIAAPAKGYPIQPPADAPALSELEREADGRPPLRKPPKPSQGQLF